MCPGWLKAVGEKKNFIVKPIPERVAVVKFIFQQSVSGIGNYLICKTLNAKRFASFQIAKRGDGKWQTGSIQKILVNRAVLGEFQPCKRINKKQVPEGPPIENYYPKIIDEGLFDRAAAARRARLCRDKDGTKHPIGGRRGALLPNLFTGIAVRCLYCSGPMYYNNKRDNGNASYACSNATRGLGCEPANYNYGHFETSFLAQVDELNLEHMTRSEGKASLRSKLQGEIENDKARLSNIESKMDDLLEMTHIPKVKKKLEDLETDRVELARAIEVKSDQLFKLTSEAKLFYQSRDEIKGLVHLLQNKDSLADDLYRVRATVNAKLKSLVASIRLAVVGTTRTPSSAPARPHVMIPKDGAARFFQVVFTNGESCGVKVASGWVLFVSGDEGCGVKFDESEETPVPRNISSVALSSPQRSTGWRTSSLCAVLFSIQSVLIFLIFSFIYSSIL
jgi:hypothetical protein